MPILKECNISQEALPKDSLKNPKFLSKELLRKYSLITQIISADYRKAVGLDIYHIQASSGTTQILI